MECNIDLNAKDNDGDTGYALSSGQVKKLILDNSAQFNIDLDWFEEYDSHHQIEREFDILIEKIESHVIVWDCLCLPIHTTEQIDLIEFKTICAVEYTII